ncbi:hypothetical protein SAXI111661_02295 [Saccharomonospora xinjiangensis]|uniref:hypothetical protein n=1 Tax=Saccharomonospora xinjiangensis TaxID=75294 RepID=UPI00106F2E8E|nr:hypothetical protein [Saccharomonospora xinjiangensis]QBQ62025.1 hypothetical protein EYD13_18430 [Saccharomonospora xinjiangensis]
MSTRVVLDGPVYVHYGQFYVESGTEHADMEKCFAGQENGLCGAASPGVLFCVTGLHTGSVRLTVEVCDGEPELDDRWEDVVEVSFRPSGAAQVTGWCGEWGHDLDLAECDYRVRYSARDMDAGGQRDTSRDDEDDDCEDCTVDAYLLQFWPAPKADDVVVRQTSDTAAYWHGVSWTPSP